MEVNIRTNYQNVIKIKHITIKHDRPINTTDTFSQMISVCFQHPCIQRSRNPCGITLSKKLDLCGIYLVI